MPPTDESAKRPEAYAPGYGVGPPTEYSQPTQAPPPNYEESQKAYPPAGYAEQPPAPYPQQPAYPQQQVFGQQQVYGQQAGYGQQPGVISNQHSVVVMQQPGMVVGTVMPNNTGAIVGSCCVIWCCWGCVTGLIAFIFARMYNKTC